MIDWWRIAAYGLAATLLLGGAAGWGYFQGVQKLWDYQAKQAREAVKIVTRQGAATVKVVTEYVEVSGKTEYVTRYIDREVEIYVESSPDSLKLDARWGILHDAAATNTLPGTPSEDHGAGRAPSAAQALQTVTGNYAACHRTADRLDAAQAWIRAQKEANP